MRIAALMFGLVLVALFAPQPAGAAHVYRYCASYEDRGDTTCAYDTFQQCLDTARGPAGGTCSENPAWQPESATPARRKTRKSNQ